MFQVNYSSDKGKGELLNEEAQNKDQDVVSGICPILASCHILVLMKYIYHAHPRISILLSTT